MAQCAEDSIYRFLEDLGWPFHQINGQRILGPKKGIPTPGPGCEIMIRRLPLDFFENQLFRMCAKFGPIYSIRLLVNFTGETRGVAYVKFKTLQSANMAVKKLNRRVIKKEFITVVKSIDNVKLYVGGVPANVKEEELLQRLVQKVDGISSVQFGPNKTTNAKSCKYAFVEFGSHREAALARRYFQENYTMWGKTIRVDWAKPENVPNPDAMATNKRIFIRNLAPFISVSNIVHIILTIMPSEYIERIYKKSGYGFIHLTTHNAAAFLISNLKDMVIGNLQIHVEWARPPSTEELLTSNYKSVPYEIVKERRRRRLQNNSNDG